MVPADVLKTEGGVGRQRVAVHDDAADGIALIRCDVVGVVRTAGDDVRLTRCDVASRRGQRSEHELSLDEGCADRVVGGDMFEEEGGNSTHLHAVHRHRLDVVAVVRGDCHCHRLIVSHCGVGGSDGAALTRRCRDRKLVDGK